MVCADSAPPLSLRNPLPVTFSLVPSVIEPLTVRVALFTASAFATAEPVTVTAPESLMTTLSPEPGAAPDCQSAAFDQSPAEPVIHNCVDILVNTSKHALNRPARLPQFRRKRARKR